MAGEVELKVLVGRSGSPGRAESTGGAEWLARSGGKYWRSARSGGKYWRGGVARQTRHAAAPTPPSPCRHCQPPAAAASHPSPSVLRRTVLCVLRARLSRGPAAGVRKADLRMIKAFAEPRLGEAPADRQPRQPGPRAKLGLKSRAATPPRLAGRPRRPRPRPQREEVRRTTDEVARANDEVLRPLRRGRVHTLVSSEESSR